VQADLRRQGGSVLGKAPLIFLGAGLFAALLAQPVLVEDQIDGRLGVGSHPGMPRQVVLGRDALSKLPAPALIEAQQRRRLGSRQRPHLGEQGVHVGSLAAAPQPFQLPGRIERAGRRGGGDGLRHELLPVAGRVGAMRTESVRCTPSLRLMPANSSGHRLKDSLFGGKGVDK